MSRIRTYLLEKIYKFRKPMTNYQIPQNAMLKHEFFFEFVLSNERQVAQEICNEYFDTMSKIYYSYFKSYSLRLVSLKFEEACSKDDLMGIEDTISKGLFSKTTNLKNKSTIFTIGKRDEILNQQLEAPIIVPHAQLKSKYTFEALFRSEQYALVDNACREYLFVTEVFMVRGQQAQDLFNQIMGKTLTLMIIMQIYLRTPKGMVKDEELRDCLRELKFKEEYIDDISKVLHNHRDTLTRNFYKAKCLRSPPKRLQWRINISLSNSDIAQYTQPTIIIGFQMNNGDFRILELTLAMFHRLRYNIAVLLKEMQSLESRAVMKKF